LFWLEVKPNEAKFEPMLLLIFLILQLNLNYFNPLSHTERMAHAERIKSNMFLLVLWKLKINHPQAQKYRKNLSSPLMTSFLLSLISSCLTMT
jgi:hypothetical protein